MDAGYYATERAKLSREYENRITALQREYAQALQKLNRKYSMKEPHSTIGLVGDLIEVRNTIDNL